MGSKEGRFLQLQTASVCVCVCVCYGCGGGSSSDVWYMPLGRRRGLNLPTVSGSHGRMYALHKISYSYCIWNSTKKGGYKSILY